MDGNHLELTVSLLAHNRRAYAQMGVDFILGLGYSVQIANSLFRRLAVDHSRLPSGELVTSKSACRLPNRIRHFVVGSNLLSSSLLPLLAVQGLVWFYPMLNFRVIIAVLLSLA